MTPSPNGGYSESASETFEQALVTLLRDSFAGGADIEGTWELPSQSDIVPDWRVIIEKTSGAVPPDNGDEFIDE